MEKKKSGLLAGIVAGIVLLIVGTIMLWWNEGNNVKNIKTVKEVKKNVIEISSTAIDKEANGKLVVTNGEMKVLDGVVLDNSFNIGIETAVLRREVEIYQWQEEKETNDKNTTYTYKKEWSSELIDSSDFNDNKHINPTQKPYANTDFIAKDIKVGEYYLSENQKKNLETTSRLNPEGVMLPFGYKINGEFITNSVNPNNPEVGDVRISWRYNNWKKASVLAKLSGNSFVDYVSEAGKSVNMVAEGLLSSNEMIIKMEQSNNMLKWIFRVVGVLMIIFGYQALISPITKLASYVPILGKIVGGALFFVCLLIGLIHSLFIIAISWIIHRPLLGILLLAICIGLIVLVRKIIKKENKEN